MNIGLRVSLTAVLVAFAFYSGHGWADAWQQAGSAKVSAEYDTNPAMVGYAQRVGIWRSLFEPSYKLKRAGGASELNAGIAFQIARSSNQALSQNREDPSVFLDWRQRSETGELGISAKYDVAATRFTEIDNAGATLMDGTRVSRAVSGNWSNALGERNTLSADGAYQKYSYEGGSYVDYANQSAGLKFSHALSERNTLSLRLSNMKYIPIGGSSSSNLATAIVGWEWMAADYLGGSFQAGKSKSSDVGSGAQGAATVNYTGQRTGLVINAGRQVTPTGLGGFVTVDQANGNWNYVMSEFSRVGIDLGWQKSHLVADIYNRTTGVWLQHELNSFWVVRTYFLHKGRYQSAVGKAYSNMLGLALTYTYADF